MYVKKLKTHRCSYTAMLSHASIQKRDIRLTTCTFRCTNAWGMLFSTLSLTSRLSSSPNSPKSSSHAVPVSYTLQWQHVTTRRQPQIRVTDTNSDCVYTQTVHPSLCVCASLCASTHHRGVVCLWPDHTLMQRRLYCFVCTLLLFLWWRLNRSSSLCCRDTKLTAAYSNSAEKTKSRHTAIQMSMALT